MFLFNVLINIIFIITCSYIAGISYKTFFYNTDVTEITSFFWAISYSLVGIGFLICLLDMFFVFTNIFLTVFLHTTDTMVFLFQLTVALHLFYAANDSLTLFKQKMIRIIAMLFAFLFIGLFSSLISSSILYIDHSIVGSIHIIGNYTIDIGIEVFHAVIACAIFFLLPKLYPFNIVSYGFLVLSISEIAQVVNIINHPQGLYCFNCLEFVVEWVTAIIAICLMCFGMYLIYKKKKEHGIID